MARHKRILTGKTLLTIRMENNDRIMTLEEVAEYLRVKPQTVYIWAQEKKIPAAKLGREWRFRKSMIDKWFDESMDDKFKNL
jgi:excisionase family DNA binding protein